MKQLSFFIVMTLVFSVNCRESKTKRYDNYREKNIEACISLMVSQGQDSIHARKICGCMLDAAFILDSTFIDLNGKERDRFLIFNKEKIEFICDSLRNHSMIPD